MFTELTPPTTLTDNGNGTYPVDIVAIHGPTGDNHSTWEEDGVIWLRDLIPKDLPGARVFSYGYDSSDPLGTSTLDAYARDLLNLLKICLKDRTAARVRRLHSFIIHRTH